ncbi:MAG: amidohydrolase, partial [Acidobacteria bacterium]
MSKYTRGEFLGFGAVLAGAFTLGRIPGVRQSASAQQLPPPPAGAEPDLMVVNGVVYTSDPAQPRAEAFAVKNGRFVAVGSTADIRNLATRRTQVLDAQRMTVTPGFIDAHCHPSGVQELYGVNTNLRTVREIQAAIRRKAESAAPEVWVTGFMFDDTKLDRPLTRKDLDEATRDHPVSVAHRGGHTTFYNSKAFELAGITAATPDPPDGRFFKENGELTGRVAENARNVFSRVGTRETFTPEQQRERGRNGMRHMSELFNAAGLTSVHNAGTSPEAILAYEDCRRNGELTHRAYMMIRSPAAFSGFKAANVYTGFGDEWIRVGGVKFVADGSASERTMRMSTPYVGTNDYGILTMTQDQLYEAIDDAHSHNFQVGVHANGDVTIDMVLNAYERALRKWPDPNRRHRIEHCTLVNPDLIRRIKANGVIPTPFWTYVYYHGEKWKEYGDEKVRWMFAHRSFLDAGIRVPGASDYTPG